jgi:hypothetical protein
MPTEALLRTVLVLLMFQGPIIIIASVGLWFAASRRRHLARVSNWAMWGFSLVIASSLIRVGLAVLIMLVRIDARARSEPASLENIITLNLWEAAPYLLLIVGFALLTRAVFLDRRISD